MITEDTFIEMALSFNGAEQVPHFDRKGFKVIGKRMFATYLQKDHTANIFLTPEEQQVFCQIDDVNIYPVPNKWGQNGATTFDLKGVARETVWEALVSAYSEIMKKKK
ncbi:MAG: MmcQ/YjbR family DNA-binding protein [Flavisolibacter sp.]